jgi:hypothetical protein
MYQKNLKLFIAKSVISRKFFKCFKISSCDDLIKINLVGLTEFKIKNKQPALFVEFGLF